MQNASDDDYYTPRAAAPPPQPPLVPPVMATPPLPTPPLPGSNSKAAVSNKDTQPSFPAAPKSSGSTSTPMSTGGPTNQVQPLNSVREKTEEARSQIMQVNPAALPEDPEFQYSPSLWDELERDNWFHGAIPMDDVKLVLELEGDFLIRRLEDLKQNQPVLTVRAVLPPPAPNPFFYDFPFYSLDSPSGMQYTLNTTNTARSPQELVRFHMEKNIPVYENVILRKGIPKQDWELSKEHVSLQCKLGEGAFGEVWRGILTLHRINIEKKIEVAVKLMKVTASTSVHLEKMQGEARMMRQFNHRNVVKLHGILFSDTDVMIVMELVAGGGLDSYIKKNTNLSLLNKASYCFDVASGIAYLHGKNWMHRDIAARNCLVTMDGKMVKLSDFGMSVSGTSYTIPNEDRIPVRWQAPEVLAKHIYIRQSDIWSYGMLMWEVFNEGRVPFTGIPNPTIRAGLSDPTFRPPLNFRCLYPEVFAVITNCWEGEAKKRWTAEFIAGQLRKYCIHSLLDPSKQQEKYVVRAKEAKKKEMIMKLKPQESRVEATTSKKNPVQFLANFRKRNNKEQRSREQPSADPVSKTSSVSKTDSIVKTSKSKQLPKNRKGTSTPQSKSPAEGKTKSKKLAADSRRKNATTKKPKNKKAPRSGSLSSEEINPKKNLSGPKSK